VKSITFAFLSWNIERITTLWTILLNIVHINTTRTTIWHRESIVYKQAKYDSTNHKADEHT
jgi:hypothetical protein